MVTNREKHSEKMPVEQGPEEIAPEPNKINGSTPYDFNGKNLTPYGGLLPVITMLEKLGFQSLVEQTVTSKRIPRAMDLYRFVLGIVLGLYIGFPRLNQLRFIARDPILTGILKVTRLPVQSTFWRFVNALHRNVARQILIIMGTMRQRVWEAANVKLEVVTPRRSPFSARNGASENNRASVVQQRQRFLNCEQCSPNIDVEDFVEVLLCDLFQRSKIQDSSVSENHIEFSFRPDCLIKTVKILRSRDISLYTGSG